MPSRPLKILDHRLNRLMPASKALICIPICASTEREFVAAISTSTSDADFIEFRLDCLDREEFQNVRTRLSEIISATPCPVIVTFRSSEQGGHAGDRDLRLEFWRSEDFSAAAFYDIELDLIPELSSTSTIDWTKVICSHHDLERVPSDVDAVVRAMLNSPARIGKLAVYNQDAIDCLKLFQLLEQARQQEREFIAIGMGPAGIVTRVLGPSRGAFLTYATAEKGKETAPGQLTADDLRNVYRIDRINDQTLIMGIIGNPVAQSYSPRIHNAAFNATNLDAVFVPLQVEDLPAFMTRMANPRTRELDWNLHGLSVTAPHKRTVLEYLDFIEPAAKQIGAVNTIVIREENLWGYNTDVFGFLNSLKQFVGELKGMNAAVLGAGGAARAVLAGLKNEGATAVVFARDPGEAELLSREFKCDFRNLADATFGDFDLVVNATPLGMSGKLENEAAATGAQLRGARLVYDLVYNPTETRLLREARDAGCETIGGLAMLVAQATAQFKLWTGLDAPEAVMTKAAEKVIREL